MYPDRQTPELSPAYDFVSTVPYLPGDKFALNLSGTKNMSPVSLAHLKNLAPAVSDAQNDQLLKLDRSLSFYVSQII